MPWTEENRPMTQNERQGFAVAMRTCDELRNHLHEMLECRIEGAKWAWHALDRLMSLQHDLDPKSEHCIMHKWARLDRRMCAEQERDYKNWKRARRNSRRRAKTAAKKK